MNLQSYYFYIFVPFAIVLYMMSVDENVGKFIDLIFKLLRVQIMRAIFWLKFYPKLRYDTYMLKRKIPKIIKELQNPKADDK